MSASLEPVRQTIGNLIDNSLGSNWMTDSGFPPCSISESHMLFGPTGVARTCQLYQLFNISQWRTHINLTIVASANLCTSQGGDRGRVSVSVLHVDGNVVLINLNTTDAPADWTSNINLNCSNQRVEWAIDPRTVVQLNFTFTCIFAAGTDCNGSGDNLTLAATMYRSGSLSPTAALSGSAKSVSMSRSVAVSLSRTYSSNSSATPTAAAPPTPTFTPSISVVLSATQSPSHSAASLALSPSVSMSMTLLTTTTLTSMRTPTFTVWRSSLSQSVTHLSQTVLASPSPSDSRTRTHSASATQRILLTQTPSPTIAINGDSSSLSFKEGSDVALGVVSTMLSGLAPSPAASQIVLGASQCALPPGAEPAVSNAMYMISPFYGSSWGMALGNTMLAAAVAGIHMAVVWCAARRGGSQFLDVRSLCRTRFPHWSLMFLTITVQGTLVGAAGCFFEGGPLIAVALVGVGLGAAPTAIAITVRAKYVRPSGAQLEPLDKSVALSERWFAPVLPTHYWAPATSRLRFAACFSAMRSLAVAWWLAVPSFVVPLVFAFVGGIRVAEENRGVVCNVALGIGIAVLCMAMLCCVWLRPYRYPLRNALCVVELALLAVATIFTLHSVRESVGESSANNVTASMSLLQMAVVCLQCAYVGVLTLTVDCPPHDEREDPKTIGVLLEPLRPTSSDGSGFVDIFVSDDDDEMLPVATPPLPEQQQQHDEATVALPRTTGNCEAPSDETSPVVHRGSSIDMLREFYRSLDDIN